MSPKHRRGVTDFSLQVLKEALGRTGHGKAHVAAIRLALRCLWTVCANKGPADGLLGRKVRHAAMPYWHPSRSEPPYGNVAQLIAPAKVRGIRCPSTWFQLLLLELSVEVGERGKLAPSGWPLPTYGFAPSTSGFGRCGRSASEVRSAYLPSPTWLEPATNRFRAGSFGVWLWLTAKCAVRSPICRKGWYSRDF